MRHIEHHMIRSAVLLVLIAICTGMVDGVTW